MWWTLRLGVALVLVVGGGLAGRADGPPRRLALAVVPPPDREEHRLSVGTSSTVGTIPPSIPVPVAAVPSPEPDAMAAPDGPGVGTWCADGVDGASLNAFFSASHGPWQGGDYLRAFSLPDGRVLWLMQDALIGGVIVHNAGLVQSGSCFSLLATDAEGSAPHSWLFADSTVPFRHWFWPLAGVADRDGVTFHLLLAEVRERGPRYLTEVEPEAVYLVDLRVSDLSVIRWGLAPEHSSALYGFSIASDVDWTYLYSNCHRQFEPGLVFGDPCLANATVARVPKGELDATPRYWNGATWGVDPQAAVPVVSPSTTGFGVNPAQVMYDGRRFVLIEKEGDWFGTFVLVQVSSHPAGPWTTVAIAWPTEKCEDCNTYFASLLPWVDADGALLYTLSHNRWDGRPSEVYRPTVQSIRVPRGA